MSKMRVALKFFTLGLVVHSLLEVIARSFYADKDTLTPFWAALGGATINLVLSYALSGVMSVESSTFHNLLARQFPALGLYPVVGNVGGLALANSLGVAFEVVTLLVVLRRRWHGIRENELARTLAKTLAASLVMGLVIVVINTVWVMAGLDERGIPFTVAQLGIEVVVGGLAFLGAAWLLRMGELRAILDMLLRRRNLTEIPA